MPLLRLCPGKTNPRCGGRLRVIATVLDSPAVQVILAHLARSGVPAPPGPALPTTGALTDPGGLPRNFWVFAGLEFQTLSPRLSAHAPGGGSSGRKAALGQRSGDHSSSARATRGTGRKREHERRPSHCARNCARDHLDPAPRQPPRAKTANENPSARCELTEGLKYAPELMRPLLCHLSYAAENRVDTNCALL
jgi:hypothetical protein